MTVGFVFIDIVEVALVDEFGVVEGAVVGHEVVVVGLSDESMGTGKHRVEVEIGVLEAVHVRQKVSVVFCAQERAAADAVLWCGVDDPHRVVYTLHPGHMCVLARCVGVAEEEQVAGAQVVEAVVVQETTVHHALRHHGLQGLPQQGLVGHEALLVAHECHWEHPGEVRSAVVIAAAEDIQCAALAVDEGECIAATAGTPAIAVAEDFLQVYIALLQAEVGGGGEQGVHLAEVPHGLLQRFGREGEWCMGCAVHGVFRLAQQIALAGVGYNVPFVVEASGFASLYFHALQAAFKETGQGLAVGVGLDVSCGVDAVVPAVGEQDNNAVRAVGVRVHLADATRLGHAIPPQDILQVDAGMVGAPQATALTEGGQILRRIFAMQINQFVEYLR